jgi:hypothetical protein
MKQWNLKKMQDVRCPFYLSIPARYTRHNKANPSNRTQLVLSHTARLQKYIHRPSCQQVFQVITIFVLRDTESGVRRISLNEW